MMDLKDLRDERSHMEGLLNQRFNFFIIMFGVIVATLPYVNNTRQLYLIFITGFLVELSFTLLIRRAARRLKINMELLKEEGDVSEEIRKKADDGSSLNPFKYSQVRLMGYVLPIFFTVSLLVALFFARGILEFFQKSHSSFC
jgi:hypothetical protein